MIGATFPDGCSTPAVDIFSDIDVIYIEEQDESVCMSQFLALV